jgi:hypothetical protein
MAEDNMNDLRISFDVALSFAGEDRKLAEEMANLLASKGIRVFYDGFMKSEIWGKDLYEYLADVYEKRANFCVMFVSEHYRRNKWTIHERRNAQARALTQGPEYILPIRVDDTKLPGLPDTIAYLDIRNSQLSEIVDTIVEKIHGESDESLAKRDEWVSAQLWEKSRRGHRFACSVCGEVWGNPDNFWYCLHCQSVYCYKCVESLRKIPEKTKFNKICVCGGRVT